MLAQEILKNKQQKLHIAIRKNNFNKIIKQARNQKLNSLEKQSKFIQIISSNYIPDFHQLKAIIPFVSYQILKEYHQTLLEKIDKGLYKKGALFCLSLLSQQFNYKQKYAQWILKSIEARQIELCQQSINEMIFYFGTCFKLCDNIDCKNQILEVFMKWIKGYNISLSILQYFILYTFEKKCKLVQMYYPQLIKKLIRQSQLNQEVLYIIFKTCENSPWNIRQYFNTNLDFILKALHELDKLVHILQIKQNQNHRYFQSNLLLLLNIIFEFTFSENSINFIIHNCPKIFAHLSFILSYNQQDENIKNIMYIISNMCATNQIVIHHFLASYELNKKIFQETQKLLIKESIPWILLNIIYFGNFEQIKFVIQRYHAFDRITQLFQLNYDMELFDKIIECLEKCVKYPEYRQLIFINQIEKLIQLCHYIGYDTSPHQQILQSIVKLLDANHYTIH